VSQVRLYFDADSMQRALLAALRARGVDATTALEAGMADRPDDEQLAFAKSEGRVLFSYNASDFCRIHAQLLAQGKSHAGIILAPQQRYSIGERVRRLLKLIAAKTADQMHDQVEFLSDWN
jgi:predicted nuclease of predicted toxin-antitoxin system